MVVLSIIQKTGKDTSTEQKKLIVLRGQATSTCHFKNSYFPLVLHLFSMPVQEPGHNIYGSAEQDVSEDNSLFTAQ